MLDCHASNSLLTDDLPSLEDLILSALRQTASGSQPPPSQITLLQSVAGGSNQGLAGIGAVVLAAEGMPGVEKKKGKEKAKEKATRKALKALLPKEDRSLETSKQKMIDEVERKLGDALDDEDDGESEGYPMDEMEVDNLESEDGMNSLQFRATKALLHSTESLDRMDMDIDENAHQDYFQPPATQAFAQRSNLASKFAKKNSVSGFGGARVESAFNQPFRSGGGGQAGSPSRND